MVRWTCWISKESHLADHRYKTSFFDLHVYVPVRIDVLGLLSAYQKTFSPIIINSFRRTVTMWNVLFDCPIILRHFCTSWCHFWTIKFSTWGPAQYSCFPNKMRRSSRWSALEGNPWWGNICCLNFISTFWCLVGLISGKRANKTSSSCNISRLSTWWRVQVTLKR